MGFDVAGFLKNLFDGAKLPSAAALEAVAVPEGGRAENLTTGDGPAPVVALNVAPTPSGEPDPDPSADPFAGWVQRPDCHGRMGWETPDLPEAVRWWARFDFDDLPEVPEGFSFGDKRQPAHPDCAGCVSGGLVDILDLPGRRPVQGHFQGFGGA